MGGTTAGRASAAARTIKKNEARACALEEVRARPGIAQAVVAVRVQRATGLAPSTILRLLRELEAQGALESGRDGRRKTYRVVPQPSDAADDHPEPPAEPARDHPAEPPVASAEDHPAERPVERARDRAEPPAEPAGPPSDLTEGSPRELAVLAGGVFLVCAIVAFLLAPHP